MRIWFLTEDVGNPAGADKIQPMVVLTTSTWSLNTFYVLQDNLSGEFGVALEVHFPLSSM